MTDVALQWADGVADSSVAADDLLAEEGLQTAVVLSLFCHRRAESNDQLPPGETQRRGWWADAFASDISDRTGSKLWLLWREKRTDETLQRAKKYCEEALAWLIEDGVASTVVVATSWASIAALTGSGVNPHEYALVIELEIVRPTGTHESYRYAYNWDRQIQKER